MVKYSYTRLFATEAAKTTEKKIEKTKKLKL